MVEFENKDSQSLTFHDRVKLPDHLDKTSLNIQRIKLLIAENDLTYQFFPRNSYSRAGSEPVIIKGNR